MPDERLAVCARLAKSAKIIPTQLEFIDIAGLVRGASKGQGLGNQFLGHLREVDAIAHLLRCFEDDNVVHVEGSVDPIRDAETVETELMLADLDSLERREVAAQKRARGGEREAKKQLEVMGPVLAALRDGRPARQAAVPEDRQRELKAMQLLTAKPILYIANVDEIAAGEGNALSRKVADYAASQGAPAVTIAAAIEAELAVLADAEERREFLEVLGLAETGLDQVIYAGYGLLGPDHLFHRRPEGSRAPGPSRAAPRRRKPPASSTAISKRASSAPKPLPTTISSPAAASRAPKTPARCGSKAPTTSCRTATSCISASMCEPSAT